MAEYDDRLSVALPESLRRKFDEVLRRLWRVETTVAVCAVIGGLLASLLALFVSDRLWDTPVWMRATLLICGLAAAVAAALIWMRRWVWRRRDLRDLANLVQKKYRRLGDRLLGVVELSNEERHNANFSPALYHAAIHQVADQAKDFDFRQSVSVKAARKAALGAVGVAACLALIFCVLPAPGWNALERWALPTADIARYTLVVVEGLPSQLVVAHGESFPITANVKYRTFWKPGHGFALWPRQAAVEAGVQNGTLRLQIPGQVENGVLEVRVGDATVPVKVLPTYRPALKELAAEIKLPDYLKYPDTNQPLQDGALITVEGSEVAFQGKITRGLSSAHMQNGDGKPAPLHVDGDEFSSALTRPDAASEFTINWLDNLGLSNSAPLRLSVQTQPDAPPIPDIPDLPRDIALLDSDVLDVRLQANDDFGVRDYGLTWETTSTKPRTGVQTTELKTETPSTRVKTVEKVFQWSPQIFGVPDDSTVELVGYARDYFPKRERSRTASYIIHVMTPEEHAEMLRQQLEALMAQVEEVTRLQEKIVAQLSEVKDAGKTNMTDEQRAGKLGQSKDDQTRNAAKLGDITKNGQRLVREAMKNPLMNEDTISKWNKSMQQWDQLSAQKMPDAANSMQAAQQSSASQPQQTAEAEQKAEDILKQLEENEQKANEHLDDLQATTLSQRLRKVGGKEKEIGQEMYDSASNTVGVLPDELPPKLQLFEKGLTHDQSGEQVETVNLQAEISRFFERTQKPAYGDVSKEMKDTHVTDELDRVGGLIGDNIGIQASTDLNRWADRFQKWGAKLEPPPSNGGGGQGGKGQDLTKQLIALLRLRESEMNLRDETTLLDQDKAEPSYPQRADGLADNQNSLATHLELIHEQVPIEDADPAFAQVSGAMKDALTQLHKPETGKPADDAEVKSVDSLTDLINIINEESQHGASKPSQGQAAGEEASQMEYLMQMMRDSANAKAFAAKPATGMNHAGGTTDHVGGNLTGNSVGQAAAARKVGRASGVIENAPVEFREALENYYHGLEKAKD